LCIAKPFSTPTTRGLVKNSNVSAVPSSEKPERPQAGRGVRTGRKLADFVWYWRDDVQKLVAYLDRFGDALHQAALTYEHTDHAGADLFDIRGR
jgi:hypothetical protein